MAMVVGVVLDAVAVRGAVAVMDVAVALAMTRVVGCAECQVVRIG